MILIPILEEDYINLLFELWDFNDRYRANDVKFWIILQKICFVITITFTNLNHLIN